MQAIMLQVGALGTNCYILYCEKTLQAAVIDPGGDAAEIMNEIGRRNLTVAYILNTHGHADHIGANDEIKARTNAPICIHEADAAMLTSAQKNLSLYIGQQISGNQADRLLADGDLIELGEIKLTVVHTPGHTPGGICFVGEDFVFSGDTLFAQSVGRTDFPGGSHVQLVNSIKNKLMALPDAMQVFPGHGPATTIGEERTMNPFIQ
ncbi:MBL fold metallo-hydrolase [Azotosporobacter soli]|uniref:MBL fold metallo-hydrolase n=1 Tax=Azotosporobacter soli TaxID=3055040 RepID=UPI0031FF1538